jgi:predicted DNA-binding mobile mystery protein A
MNIQNTARQQYQRIVERTNSNVPELKLPAEGWMRTMRKALGITGAQLARKMGVTRALVSQAESNEISGNVNLKTLQRMADAIGCRFVYAILPPKGKEAADIILVQALKKAKEIATQTDVHMELEGQGLYKDELDHQIDHLAKRLALEMPPGFWDDK